MSIRFALAPLHPSDVTVELRSATCMPRQCTGTGRALACNSRRGDLASMPGTEAPGYRMPSALKGGR